MVEAAIVSMGMVTPIGLDAEQSAASARAGIARKAESEIMDDRYEPIVLGCLPDDVLPPLEETLEDRDERTPLQQRLVRLAAPAFQEAQLDEVDPARTPVFLAGARPLPSRGPVIDERFFESLELQSGISFARAESELFPIGRGGFFRALKAAIEGPLAQGTADYAWVGGVDSYVDLWRLHLLQKEDRLLRSGVMDGFTPGEGAAFFLIAKPDTCERAGLKPEGIIRAVGVADEPGHRYSDEPYLGEGLASAFAEVTSQLSQQGGVEAAPLAMVGLIGESFNAKEWGVALTRNRELVAEALQVEHPAEYTGDMGAALAPAMMGMASKWMGAGHVAGPALVWASSDHAERGAAFISRES